MFQSEKNFLERIANAIPGIKGYREKESRRDTDKRLRDYMAAELDRGRRSLDGLKRDQLSAGKLDLLDDVDRVGRKLQKCADLLRFASYGYAGFFDQVKIGEAELEKIYQYDTELLGAVRSLVAELSAAGSSADPAKAVAELERATEKLDTSIEARKQLFNTPE